MAKHVDITDKLTFDGNPALVIKDKVLEVNADAPTMLKLMQLIQRGIDDDQINEIYELILPEKSRSEIDGLKLNLADWKTVIREAMDLVTDGEDNRGE